MDDRGRVRATLRLQKNDNGVLGFSDAKWEGRAVFGFLGKDYTSTTGPDENWGLVIHDPERHALVASLVTGDYGNRGSLVVRSARAAREFVAH